MAACVPNVPRPRRGGPGWALVVAVLPLAIAGCSQHRRSSMRPIYAAPMTVPEPCSPGDPGCPAASGGGTITMPPTGSGAVPMETPAAGGTRMEPGLNPNGGAPGSSSTVTPGTGRAPRASSTRVAALRSAVEPFVDDPQDLFAPPKADRAWKYVVLHHSATPTGSYAQIDREHRQVRGYTGCGYHFVIGNGTDSPDGRVEVARRWSDQKAGAHCRDGKHPDVNEYGIGICLIGDCDKAPPTPKQVEAARALVAYLEARYAIVPDHIGTHTLLAGTPTACPGSQFPTQAILKSRGLANR
ncbi:MAG TPA: N-acetylmuramoyl-L-alanine amidase [Isosphaeraceae bacterium]|jgi:hypothetical protein|nr:N-acetylmuramoyl-L-alanine amidase [Isosphaeraceae bacterium]